MQIPTRIKQQPIFYGLVGLLLLVGCGLRLYHLGQLQAGVHQDELSNIYDGYSIAKTGADRWGQRFPVILRAFGAGDYRPPLYAWLSALTIQLFGFSVFSGRLVSALLGSAALVLVYAVGRRLGGQLFAFFALLLVTFSPWHLLYSRLAHEGAMLPPFFVIAACYLWQRAGDTGYRPRYVALLGLCVGLGTNTYQAGKLVFFLFTLLVLTDLWRHCRRFWFTATLFAGSCLVGVAPQLVALLTMPKQFFSRAANSTPTFSWGYFSTLLDNLASHLMPDFLFLSFGQQNNLSVGRLLKVELLPFYIGLWFLYRVLNRQQVIRPAYFYLLLLVAALPAALTTDNPNALRDASLAVLFPFVTAAGLVFMRRQLPRPWLQRAFVVAAAALIVGNGISCIATYAKNDDLRDANAGTQQLLVETTKKIKALQGGYRAVYLEKFGNQPYIYLLTFCGITPQQFHQASLKVVTTGEWDDFEQLGTYYFLSREAIEEKLKRNPAEALVVLKARTSKYQLLDSVQCRNEKTYFYACHAPPTAQ